MKKAIDVVLLPSVEMTMKAVEINQELLKYHEGKIVLHAENCPPHISLDMGVLDDDDFEKATSVLQGVARQFSPMNLRAVSLHTATIPTGARVSELVIKVTKELQTLHEMVMTELQPYLINNPSVDMTFNPPEVEDVIRSAFCLMLSWRI